MVRPEEGAMERVVKGEEALEIVENRLAQISLENEEKKTMDDVKTKLFP